MNPILKIMIVEDDRDSLIGLNVLLKKRGYNVANAEDAVQAIAVAKTEQPDIIILDLGLPAGGGQFVLERLRDDMDFLTTPIIILSAFPASEHRDLVENFGVFAYLEKPAGNDALLQCVHRAAGMGEAIDRNSVVNPATKIMIVEDDRDSLIGLNVLLKKRGYNVANAEDAAQAMAVAKKEQPDIIILDLGLPAGGGQFVLERLRDDMDFLTTPIIILSAFPASEHRDLVENFAVLAYLEKPAGKDELLQCVHRAVGKVEAKEPYPI